MTDRAKLADAIDPRTWPQGAEPTSREYATCLVTDLIAASDAPPRKAVAKCGACRKTIYRGQIMACEREDCPLHEEYNRDIAKWGRT